MHVDSVRFGRIEVGDEQVLEFPHGIPGFESARRFFVMDHVGNPRIKWLHSIDEPELALVVADPFQLFAEYQPDVPDEVVEELGIKSPDDALLLTVLTVRAGSGVGPAATASTVTTAAAAVAAPEITANLLAPIVISRSTRQGMQAVLRTGGYSVRNRVELGSESNAG